jgi:N-acetyltransferase
MDIDTAKLKGRYVYLEPLKKEYKELIRPLAKDERIWEFNKGFVFDKDFDAQFETYFAIALNTHQAFVIHKSENHEIIGMTRLYELNETDRHIMIGYTWYIPAVWGKVYNKECKLLLLQYVFEVMKFNRVELRVVHQNIRSQKAIEKIGGVKEGILRKHGYRNDGTLKDTVIFSIIDDEWNVKKENLLRLIAESEND